MFHSKIGFPLIALLKTIPGFGLPWFTGVLILDGSHTGVNNFVIGQELPWIEILNSHQGEVKGDWRENKIFFQNC